MQDPNQRKNCLPISGFTIWELLTSVTVTAVVLGLGLPAAQNIVLDAKLSASVQSFVSAVQFARTEAAKRGRGVILCQSTDQRRCTGSNDYASGWIVISAPLDDVLDDVPDDVPDGALEGAPDEARSPVVLRVGAPRLVGSILANRTAFEFRPYLKRSTNGTLTFCDRRGAERARAVIVSYTGRPRITSSGQRPLRCPAPA